MLGRQSTLLNTCCLLCLGMHGYGYQLSSASRMPPLSDTTAPSLRWAPTSPDLLGTSRLSSQGTRQWHPSSGGRCPRPCRRRLLGLAPLPLDPYSERPTTCAWMGRCTALRQAPGFRLPPPLVIWPPLQWRKMPLAPHSFFQRSGQPPGDLSCRKWRPPPDGTGRNAVNDGSSRDLRCYCL